MKLVIWTHFEENYGAHDWDGHGACPQRWKNKPGSIYVVENLTEKQVAKIQESGIPTLRSLIEYSSDYSSEMVANYSCFKDAETPWAEWEEPTFLSYAEGAWHSQTFKNARDHGYHQSIRTVIENYKLMPGGERTDHEVYYVTNKNEVLSYEEWMAAYANSVTA